MQEDLSGNKTSKPSLAVLPIPALRQNASVQPVVRYHSIQLELKKASDYLALGRRNDPDQQDLATMAAEISSLIGHVNHKNWPPIDSTKSITRTSAVNIAAAVKLMSLSISGYFVEKRKFNLQILTDKP
jgi:hypothetical protein